MDSTLPAGSYYVGDLCYVVRGDDWDRLLGITNFEDGIFEMEFKGKLYKFAIWGTAYGDGEYFDSAIRSYPVDSGTIGCIPVDAVDISDNNLSGNIIEFTEEFTTDKVGGLLNFGHIVIDTDGQEDYLNEDEDEDLYWQSTRDEE